MKTAESIILYYIIFYYIMKFRVRRNKNCDVSFSELAALIQLRPTSQPNHPAGGSHVHTWQSGSREHCILDPH